MNLSHLKTITELAAFPEGSQAVAYVSDEMVSSPLIGINVPELDK